MTCLTLAGSSCTHDTEVGISQGCDESTEKMRLRDDHSILKRPELGSGIGSYKLCLKKKVAAI